MIKSMLKRARLSISRKPSKTIILVIVMFVMANLVLASIAIKNAVNESTKFAKQSLGSTVYLSADMDKIREEAMQNRDQNSGGTGNFRMNITRPTIYVDMVKTIAESSYVKDYTYGINATAEESGFTAIESDDNSPSFGGMNRNMSSIYGNMSIVGINSYAFISEVQGKIMDLVDGTYFDETTNGKAIISDELAQENELKVGDKIKLVNKEIDMSNYNPRSNEDPTVTSSETFEVEIIGIYDVNTDNFNTNTIYMNVETAAQFLKQDGYNDGNYGVENVAYFLNDPEEADAFISEVNKKYPSLSNENLKLDIDSSSYDQMVGPIESVGSFADTVLWIVIIASVLIITLIINNNIKDRKYEIGVLMSLGGSKKNVVGGFLVELIIIGTIGFALSIGTSYFLANSMGQNLLESQLKQSEEQSENNFGRPGAGGMGGNFQFGRNSMDGMNNNNSNVEAINNIDISVSVSDYALLFMIGYLIAGVAMIIPSMNIVKYEPKTILTGRQ